MQFKEGKQIAIFCLAAVMVAGFVLFRYVPLHKKKQIVERAKAAQTKAISDASAESKQLPALKEQLQQLQRVVGDYETKIPLQRDIGGFLHRIATLMDEHNLKNQLVQPGEEIQTEDLNCIPVSMECRGRLEQIFGFYKSLQELNRAVRIEQVELINDSDFSGEVNMHTKVSIYYRS